MTQITGKTGLTGLLGSPVAHSISPSLCTITAFRLLIWIMCICALM